MSRGERLTAVQEGEIWRPNDGADRRIVALFSATVTRKGSRVETGDRVLYSTGGAANRDCSRETFRRWIKRARAVRVGDESPNIMEEG